jgi:hypothetical protein
VARARVGARRLPIDEIRGRFESSMCGIACRGSLVRLGERTNEASIVIEEPLDDCPGSLRTLCHVVATGRPISHATTADEPSVDTVACIAPTVLRRPTSARSS